MRIIEFLGAGLLLASALFTATVIMSPPVREAGLTGAQPVPELATADRCTPFDICR